MVISLVPNRTIPEAVASAQAIKEWAESRGIQAYIVLEREEIPFSMRPDLIVALGGDGTILKAVHLFEAQLGPVLGIKFGKLGFLSGAHSDDVINAVEYAISEEAFKEKRSLLAIRVALSDGSVHTYRALNEAVIGRALDARVVSTSLAINGHYVYTLRGDGLIISTATGSTAYALSAGGPVVSPGYEGMVVVPLASHTLVQRAMVTAPNDGIEVTFPEQNRSEVTITVDGLRCDFAEASPVSVKVAIADESVELIKRDNRLFYDTVSAEFFRGA